MDRVISDACSASVEEEIDGRSGREGTHDEGRRRDVGGGLGAIVEIDGIGPTTRVAELIARAPRRNRVDAGDLSLIHI